jgi:hypothetical protein
MPNFTLSSEQAFELGHYLQPCGICQHTQGRVACIKIK